MKLLNVFGEFKKYYDLDTKQTYYFETIQKTFGMCNLIESKLTGLFVENNNLYFLNEEDKILLTDLHRAFINKKNEFESEFILFEGNIELFKFIYPIPDLSIFVFPFDDIEDEDIKWGEFLIYVINNETSKKSYVEVNNEINGNAPK